MSTGPCPLSFRSLPQQGGRFVVRRFVGVIRRPVTRGEAEGFFGVLAEGLHVAAVFRQLCEDEVGVRALENVAAAVCDDQASSGAVTLSWLKR